MKTNNVLNSNRSRNINKWANRTSYALSWPKKLCERSTISRRTTGHWIWSYNQRATYGNSYCIMNLILTLINLIFSCCQLRGFRVLLIIHYFILACTCTWTFKRTTWKRNASFRRWIWKWISYRLYGSHGKFCKIIAEVLSQYCYEKYLVRCLYSNFLYFQWNKKFRLEKQEKLLVLTI